MHMDTCDHRFPDVTYEKLFLYVLILMLPVTTAVTYMVWGTIIQLLSMITLRVKNY